MEQVLSLINKLEQQIKQGSAATELLQSIAAVKQELQMVAVAANPVQRDSVAVWLPPGYKSPSPSVTFTPQPSHSPAIESKPVVEPVRIEKEAAPVFVPQKPVVPTPPQVVSVPEPEPVTANYREEEEPAALQFHYQEERPQAPSYKAEPVPALKPFPQYPDPAVLMKTMFPVAPEPKPVPKEVNELVADPAMALNDKLQERKVELADVLAKTGPRVNDLRKAIAINEKYQMINSLFRGDEDMFERSVRTLNNFGSLPEARFWMQRELVVKLGWNEKDELVQHFYMLVSRRFS